MKGYLNTYITMKRWQFFSVVAATWMGIWVGSAIGEWLKG